MTDPSAAGRAFGPNAWLVDEMYEQYRSDPGSVAESWRDFFDGYGPDNGSAPAPATTAPRPAPAPAPRVAADGGEPLRGAAARLALL